MQKFSLPVIVVLLPMLALVLQARAQGITVMTYNIWYDNPNDGENRWDNRKADLATQIQAEELDMVGIQEGLIHQVQFLDQRLTDFTRIGVGRDDGFEKGEFTALFFRRERFSVIQQGTFWLS